MILVEAMHDRLRRLGHGGRRKDEGGSSQEPGSR